MRIELQNKMVLQPGTFTAVVAPEKTIINLVNTNPDLQRYLSLFVGGTSSRILPGIHRTVTRFEVQRAFTAHQLFTILTESAHTVILIEHDPTLYDQAWGMIAPIAGAIDECSRDALVILYSPTADRAFCALTQTANRFYFLSPLPKFPANRPSPGISPYGASAPSSYQRTLGVWLAA
jgi:DNA polymerase I